MTISGSRPTWRRWFALPNARFAMLTLLSLLIAISAIAIGLALTPMQEVHTAGQDVKVGATRPSWDLSGPGELDLFGQQLPTSVDFVRCQHWKSTQKVRVCDESR